MGKFKVCISGKNIHTKLFDVLTIFFIDDLSVLTSSYRNFIINFSRRYEYSEFKVNVS